MQHSDWWFLRSPNRLIYDFQHLLAADTVACGYGVGDVYAGLEAVLQLDWMAHARAVYHVGDADACYGFFGDNSFVELEADERTVIKLLEEQSVQYFLGEIDGYPDKLRNHFNVLSGLPLPKLRNHPTIPDNLCSSVLECSLDAVSNLLTAGNMAQMMNVEVDANSPNWEDIATDIADCYCMTTPTSLDALLDDCCVDDFPERTPLTIKMARKPFAVGELCAVYYGKVAADGDIQDIVLKDTLATDNGFRTKHDFEKFLVGHRAAKFLAVEFNNIKPRDCPSVGFVDANVLQLTVRWPVQPFIICEEQIPGHFQKFSNNTGYYAPNPMEGINHDAVQAFSHWTYCVTNGTMMVVDCQGAFDPVTNSFLLTNPAVHSNCIQSTMYFGGQNLGSKGYEMFFAAHQCNQYCAAMNLTTSL